MLLKMLWSRFLIGLMVVKVIVQKMIGKRINQKDNWLKLLAREQITQPPDDIWSYADKTSSCTGCGLCNSLGFGELAPLILAWPRNPLDGHLIASPILQKLENAAPALERICPSQIKLVDTIRLFKEQQQILEKKSTFL